MLNFLLGRQSRNCTGMSRRNMLRVGTLSLGGLSVADAQRGQATAGAEPAGPRAPSGNRKAVICFWLDGGPTQHETFDPKPLAPSEYRGPLDSVDTAIPGVQISGCLPRTAQLLDRVSLIRSVHHNNGDHFAAAHWMWTGYHGSSAASLDPMYPGIGAVTAKHHGANRPGMPAYVALPYAMTVGRRPGYQSSAFLGVSYNPFDAGSDPNSPRFQVQNLDLPTGVDRTRAESRTTLLGALDRVRREVDQSGLMDGMDHFNTEAMDLVTGAEAARAFQIDQENPRLRDRYGRNTVGQSALLARRLVEAGVSFVSVHSGGWDNHGGIENAMKSHGPRTDAALSSLLSDLEQRGMLDDVMVLVMGEFGRTPKINGSVGRDHWGNVMSVLLGGGGIRPGQVVGASDATGAYPKERAVKPAHVLHTIYRQLGIDPGWTNLNRAGRPIYILDEGEPLQELV